MYPKAIFKICTTLVLISSISITSAAQNGSLLRAVLTSTFLNKNVYKAKAPLVVKKAYKRGVVPNDIRDFTILPNRPTYPPGAVLAPPIALVTKTVTTTITSTPAAGPALISSTIVVTTIPSTTTSTTTAGTFPNPPAGFVGATTSTTSTSLSIPTPITTTNFLRYTVINEDNDFKYIRILPGCHFKGVSPNDTLIEYGTPGADDPSDYIFQVAKKNLNLNNHYLANSLILGKVLSVPARFRKEYWNENNKILQSAVSVGYAFGWKHKLFNNPYHTLYLNTIIYGLGVSQQKYARIAGKYVVSGKDSLSAKSDEFALTYLTLGVGLEWEKFNIGIFWGKDRMFGKLKDWVYQNKWWWGIGIGYELFK